MTHYRHSALTLLCFILTSAQAETVSERLQGLLSPSAQDEILSPEAAFALTSGRVGPDMVRFQWVIAEGYYLYRDKFQFASLSEGVIIDTARILIPRGKIKRDAAFGEVAVNTRAVSIDVPFVPRSADQHSATFQVGYQGCKEDSVCYPPITKQLNIDLTKITFFTEDEQAPQSHDGVRLSVQDRITAELKQGDLIPNMLAFFIFGLFLSFTPCVFPMIPILSGMIVGQKGPMTGARSFMLSVAYVLAMALTYALLGVLAGSFNWNIQAASQNIWLISVFSLVFVLLALSMLGVYALQLPAALQTRLATFSASQAGGRWHGAALMGAVSAVIVGPCVAPPLAGALLYISQTGNALLGGAALFSMGLGFGVPLLLIGASAGALLPRAGPWMEGVKQGFGVLMLGVAIWFLERVIPGHIAMLLWAALFVVAAVFMGALERSAKQGPWPKLSRGLALVVLMYGATLVIGAASGSHDMFNPLKNITGDRAASSHQGLDFRSIKRIADLDRALLDASSQGRYVMLDFYADWCITCIEMEENTFVDPDVKRVLSNTVLLQADVTGNDAMDQALLRRFDVFGPPAILFFGKDGNEMKPFRLVGYVKPEPFLKHLAKVFNT